jgi:Patatin-like phospholipase
VIAGVERGSAIDQTARGTRQTDTIGYPVPDVRRRRGQRFAYLDTLGVLEEIHVMAHVDSFPGASAGAITAFLLSIGYNRAKLENFLDETDFNPFFGPPAQRPRPIVGGCELVGETDVEKKLIAVLDLLPAEVNVAQWLLSGMAAVGAV